jgi:predicted enzyme related to lactoylglutathione lyase/plasmid maintenance system antidote protein VapI
MTAPAAPTTFAAVLRAELTRRCARNDRYSLRAFARALDTDHATLSQLLRGKRQMTAETVVQLGQKLGLSSEAIEAFVRDARAAQGAPSAPSVALDAARIVQDPLAHALLGLVGTEEFRSDSRFLAQMLDVTADEVNLTVQLLVRFGMLQLTSDRWRDVNGAGQLDPESFEREVWEHAARRLGAPAGDLGGGKSGHAGSGSPDATARGSDGPSPVREFQILAKNPAAEGRFYGELFGWHIDDANALGYRRIDTGLEGMKGGIWPAPPEGHSLVQLFIQVQDAKAAVARAESHGARVLMPPQGLPEGDTLAILLDPEGLPFGLFEPARPTSAR